MEKLKKIKLVIATPCYYEEFFGGTEYQAYLLAEKAVSLGYEVHYIFTAKKTIFENSLGIHLHPISTLKISHRLGRLWFLYFYTIWRILLSISPDAVYVRSGVSWSAITAYFAKRYKIKSVWHIASSDDVTPYPISSLIKKPFDIIERASIYYAIKNSTHVVAHAQFQADLVMKHYNRYASVILKEQPIPKETIYKDGTFTVVWVANIKPLKQPEIFIRLASEFQCQDKIKFLMIGRPVQGFLQERLQNQISQLTNLEYLGEQPIHIVNQILANSHVLVCTSLYEGLPNTFVQSWMREVPVISLLLDPDSILTKMKIGFLSGNINQLVKDIRLLYQNQTLRDEMGKRARKYAIKNHSLDKNMGRLIELLFESNKL